jgi:transglutaminase-like putative cysteine protease
MLLRIDHETKLAYTTPVSEHVVETRMAPLSDEDQTTLGYRLRIAPNTPITPYRDGFGNRVDLFNLTGLYDKFAVTATSYVRTHRRPGPARLVEAAWPSEEPVALEALEFLQPSPLVTRCPQLDAFLATLPAAFGGSFADGVQQIMAAVRRRLKYEKTVTTARTPVGEALDLGCGVCQDFAHLFIGACRGRGLPARYVSGYIYQPGELATHAWLQVWAGAAGWVDVDPTHDRFVDDEYVVTAVGRDYSDVPPNRGAWKGQAEETIAVTVKVEPVTRLPSDWIELDPPPARPVSPGTTATPARPARGQGLSNQTLGRPTLRHQKSQQQQ